MLKIDLQYRGLLVFAVLSLIFCIDIHAKTLDTDGGAPGQSLFRADSHDAGSSFPAVEFERRFRPYFEQRVNNKRGGGRRSGNAVRGTNIVRPTNADMFVMARIWNQLTPGFLELYKAATAIDPSEYDTFHISPMGKFKIFYSISGTDSVNLTDTIGIGISGDPMSWRVRTFGGNGVPDYIDEAAFALDSAWSMIVDRFGFVQPINIPSPDDGSTEYYSVLIARGSGEYGVTWLYGPGPGPGPGFSSYIQINSDWSGSEWAQLGYNQRPIDALWITAVHEFFHSVQFAMAWNDLTSHLSLNYLTYGWLEGSAVLMEDIAFPEINDYLQYLDRYFNNPRTPLLNNNNIYLNSIILKYLYEKTNLSDNIGFVRAVHFNHYNDRAITFRRNLEITSQTYAGKSWAETLNAFHAESYFTGNRSRRPWAFVSDAELMRRWTIPAPIHRDSVSITRNVNPNSAEFLRYIPLDDHPDTLEIIINGTRDPSLTGQTWAASLLVMEGDSDSVGIVRIPMNQSGVGSIKIADWKSKAGCLIIVSNAGTITRSVTVRFDGVSTFDSISPMRIFPNVARKSRGEAIRIHGDNITEVRITTQDGKLLDYYSESSAARSMLQKNGNTIEWRLDPNSRLAPGVYIVSLSSRNPLSNRRDTHRRKIMILP
ncbi:MAG: hypothetical protein LBU70_08800 [Chitinispirillales bacterium]|jgi:hypothetical protein|nr:hypothetical protein [Chitinispirillales bacterium]